MIKKKIAITFIKGILNTVIDSQDELGENLKTFLKDSSEVFADAGEDLLEKQSIEVQDKLDVKLEACMELCEVPEEREDHVKAEVCALLEEVGTELDLDLLCDKKKLGKWLCDKYKDRYTYRSTGKDELIPVASSASEYEDVPKVLKAFSGIVCKQFQESKSFLPTMLRENRQNMQEILRKYAESEQKNEEKYQSIMTILRQLERFIRGEKQTEEEKTSFKGNNIASEFAKKWEEILFLEDKKDKNAKKLGDVYILPDYEVLEKKQKSDSRDMDDLILKEPEYVRKSDLESVFSIMVNPEEGMENHLRVIFGAPGIGKSTLLIWLLNQDFCKSKDIRLFRFADADIVDWADGNKTLNAMLSYMGFSSKEELRGKVILWDGYDEITVTEKQRMDLLNLIENQWLKYCPVVVTCRENYIRNPQKLDSRIIHYILKPFTRDLKNKHEHDQIREFQKNYKGRVLDEVEQFLDQDTEKDNPEKSLEGIFGIPLLLYMVLSLPNVKLTSKMTKIKLYEIIFRKKDGIYDRILETNYDRRLRNYDKSHRQTSNEYIKEMMHEVSCFMAYTMFCRGSEVCYSSEAERFIEEKHRFDIENEENRKGRNLPTPGDQNEDLASLLSGGYFRYVENNEGKGEIRFVHRSLYEFYTGVFLAEHFRKALMEKKEAENQEKIVRDIGCKIGEVFSHELMSDEILQYFSYHMKIIAGRNKEFQNDLKDIPFWEQVTKALLKNGMLYFYKNHSGLPVNYIKTSYEEYQRRECVCFVNFIRFIQSIRELGGHKGYFPEQDLDVGKQMGNYLVIAAKNGIVMNLSRFNLQGICLVNGNFDKWNFSEADLRECDFHMSSLKYADLSGAQIEGTNFQGACLAGIKDDIARIQIYENENCLRADFVGGNVQSEWKKNLAPGNLYKFGHYKQGPNGKVEPILWQVLDVKDGAALLLSDKILEARAFHYDWEKGTSWEESDIRAWLNGNSKGGFLGAAFDEKEKSRILECEHFTAKNKYYSTSREQEKTSEKIFLLSYEELAAYYGKKEEYDVRYLVDFGSDLTRGYGTDYMRRSGKLYVDEKLKSSWWWLRSGGSSGGYAMCVINDGSVDVRGYYVNVGEVGIRPALWIRISNL